MNDIFMFGQNFGAITNSIKSDLHKHWLLQLFIGADEKLIINVEGQRINCRAIAVNVNTMHEFYSGNLIHFTMLVDPTTQLGKFMRVYLLKDNPYYIICEDRAVKLQMHLLNAINYGKSHNYSVLIKNVVSYFDGYTPIAIDQRIEMLLRMIDTCDCDETLHQVKYIAKAMSISESRLSHLFKEETGILLKSYIVLHKLQRVYQKIFDGESITDAAIESGFNSSSHFAFINKKMTGMSARDIIADSRFLKLSL
ncbi:AraC type HTH- domain containing protein [Gottschalkia acidurici 9a]|uniref:AraC type HTH-domain containing protein n=1 Tax=Gottschalkia acidurici (strain ATCC 7906 / DSM 604 / BCRC 14475 / CIP 104303 / KCTC 5404 / NCIMB 10678 / 9a) TaxID=1128398 RepID=K0AYP3_GOTA9|nr:helix-turn-helix domain-containing protein [Gottschalkia acidurici]AFS77541.1 AraC type HTH- domain containing protein [Gottschalkia acidurici 9a]